MSSSSTSSQSGIRAELKIRDPDDCPIAEVSGDKDTSSYSISKTSSLTSPVVTEDVMFDGTLDSDDTDVEMDEVFSYGSKQVYRFSREAGRGCACECVEELGCPVVDVHTHGGTLFVTFHAPDVETLREVLGGLRRRYDDVGVQRLIRSNHETTDHHLVFVDRSELTERQEEVLRTAQSMGYFEHPKGANAGEVADELGITTSTFTEHLSAAQKKLMAAILGT